MIPGEYNGIKIIRQNLLSLQKWCIYKAQGDEKQENRMTDIDLHMNNNQTKNELGFSLVFILSIIIKN